MKAAKAAACRNKVNGIVQQSQWNRSAKSMELLNDSIGMVSQNRQSTCQRAALLLAETVAAVHTLFLLPELPFPQATINIDSSPYHLSLVAASPLFPCHATFGGKGVYRHRGARI
jgi:hypothetical protein